MSDGDLFDAPAQRPVREIRRGVIIAEVRTRNGHLIEQTVRMNDNGSRYALRGADMLENVLIGRTAVRVYTLSGGTARLVRDGEP